MSHPLFLDQQGVLKLTGKDRKTFLQGLITNDVRLISDTQALYALLLTPQGKFLHDFFLIDYQESLFLETQKEQLTSLMKRLQVYKLRADVEIEDVSDKYAVFMMRTSDSSFFKGITFVDPRLSDLGRHCLVNRQQIDSSFLQPQDREFNFIRLQYGIPLANEDMFSEKSIPLESGLQDLNAISWSKGCYMGQELMARTRYRGELRKRLFPVQISSEIVEKYFKILNVEEQEVGELYSFQQNLGIAKLKIEAIDQPLFINQTPLKVIRPLWMNLTS